MNDLQMITQAAFFPYHDLLSYTKQRSEPIVLNKVDYGFFYIQINEDYINNGMTPNTVQFLKRMADSSASNISFKT